MSQNHPNRTGPTSGENLFVVVLVMAPSSQELEPPANPGPVQSKLSRNIQQLEQRIDLILFERSSTGVKVTRADRDFLHTAKSILDQMDLLVRSAHSASCGEAGRLVIGLFTSLSAGDLRATLQYFVSHYPRIEIGIIERSRMRLLTAHRNGAIDSGRNTAA